ncbi:MAG TPA: DUF72 domain-containing protein [Solirubrobacteraceae bacterium]|nr:DUF72 domain-containing protein [Solirubrobacteraceae bacterium]
MPGELGPDLRIGEHRVLTGSCSWTDPTLVREGDWYPRKTMSAEERLRFYAAQFPLTEIDSTYYAPPSEEQARLWTERTPDGFRFDVKAYSLLTGHPTRPQSLWSDLREELPAEVTEKRNLYAKHLSAEALEEAWRRFAGALEPLQAGGRLGAVLFQYPPWFGPRRDNRREIEALPERLGADLRICVEFRSPAWLASDRDRERTLDLLRESGLILVCLDAPASSGLPRVFEATQEDLLVIRFHGRNDETWSARTRTAAERFRYLYSTEELQDLVPSVAEAVEQAAESHLLMNNCYRDYSVQNAAELRDLLARYTGS